MYSGSNSCTNVLAEAVYDKKKHVTRIFKRSEEKSKIVVKMYS